ncbi:hypothetical protein D5F01_LYC09938 [Larimichthys crocea]|uniref:Uncharacterized protein n=1 Tax=Larimichthys crocea TaxID=215358 RepID=A0A6G0IMK5_LARCR|nr:hypothetical protein D5F01_LYC09938 [Larimichthys crocea]
MWMWRSFLCVSLVCGLALDSNTIRSSKEATQHSSEDRSHGDQVERPIRSRTETNSNSRETPTPCSTPDCYVPQSGGCSNRPKWRASAQDRAVDAETDRENQDSFNRTKVTVLGLCCARYVTGGRRCQRIPVEGEACTLRIKRDEAGTLRLRRRADLHRRQPGGVRQGQGAGRVPAPPEAGPQEHKAFWEKEADGGQLLTDSVDLI